MNKIFKVIWNHSQSAWVAVSELAKGYSKSSSLSSDFHNKLEKEKVSFRLSKVAISLFALGTVSFSMAAVEGGTAPYGTIAISESGALGGIQGGRESRTTKSMVQGSGAVNDPASANRFDARGSIAIGGAAYINRTVEAIAFGRSATVDRSVAGGIALGAYSITGPINTGNETKSLTINNATYTYAGQPTEDSKTSVLSIGSGSSYGKGGLSAGSSNTRIYQYRQIQNVAAGRVADNSTDAINGSQLYAVVRALGNVSGGTNGLTNFVVGADKNHNATGINVTKDSNRFDVISGNDAYLTTAVDGNNIKVDLSQSSQNAIDNVSKNAQNITNNAQNITKNAQNITKNAGDIAKGFGLKAQDSQTVNKKLGEYIDVVGGNSNINTTVSDGKIKINLNNSLDLGNNGNVKVGGTSLNGTGLIINNGPSVTTTGINAGNKKITNVSNGTVDANSKDAVNGSQLYATNQNVTNLNTEVNKGWNITTSKSGTGNVSGTNLSKVAMGETVTLDAGDNINITQVGKKVTIATSLTPSFNLVNTGNLTVRPNGNVNFGNNRLMNVANGTNGTDAVNLNQLNALLGSKTKPSEVKAGNNVNVTKSSAADGHDIYTVNAEKSTVSNRSDKVTVTSTPGENNTTNYAVDLSDSAKQQLAKEESVNSTTSNLIVSENGKNSTGGKNYSVNLNNTLDLTNVGSVKTGDTLLNSTGLTINNGPSVTNAGINAGNKPLTNVAAPTNNTDAANKKYVDDGRTTVNSTDGSVTVNGTGTNPNNYDLSVNMSKVANDVKLKYKGDNNTSGENKLADQVTFKGSTDIVTNATNGQVAFDLADVTKQKINSAIQNFTVGADKNHTAEGVNVTNGGRFDIVGKEGNYIETNVSDKNITVALNKTAIDAIEKVSKGFALKGQDGQNVTKQLGEAIEVEGGNSNINTTVENGKVKVNLNNTLDLSDAGSVKLGDTTLNSTGLTINNGPKVTKDGIDAGDKKVTNVTAGELSNTSKDAVNGSQLYATNQNVTNLSTEVNKGWNITTSNSGTGTVSGTNLSKVAMGETVTIDAGDNINITQADKKITIATSLTPNFTSVTTGNLTVKPNGKVDFSGNNLSNIGTPVAENDATTKKYVDDGRTTVNSTDGSVNVTKSNGQNPTNYDLSVNMSKVAQDVSFKYKGDNNTTGENKLSEPVHFKGSDYVTTNVSNGTVSFDLSNTARQKIDSAVQNFTVGADKANAAEGLNITNGGRFDIVGKDGNYIETNVSGKNITVALNQNATSAIEKAHKGFGLKAQDGNNVTHQLGEPIEVVSGNNNLNTAVSDGKVKINLNNTLDLTDAGSVKLGDIVLNSTGLTINNGPKVTKEGINAGNKAITNVANGTNGTDAVNLSQLNASTKAAKTEVKAGNNVNVVKTQDDADKHDIYTVHANSSSVSNGSDKIKITPIDKGNNVTDYAVDLSDEAKTQLAKEESVNATDSNVIVTENGTNGTGGKNYSVSLNNTLNLTEAGSVTLGNTTLNKDGLTITGGPNVTKDGISAGNKTITNVANGTNGTDAVNLSQLNATNQEVAKGWNITTSKSGTGNVTGNTTHNVKMGDLVTIDAGNNINITQSGNNISIATSMTPTFTNVTTGGLTVNPNGTVNFGGNRLENVGAPTADTDAASKKYVDDGRTTVNSTDSSVNVTKSGQNQANYDLSVNMSKVANDVSLKYKADSGNGTNKLSEEVTFKGSDYINTTAKNGEISFDLSKTAKDKLDNAVQNFTVGADKNNQATGLNITNGGRFDIVGKDNNYIETTVNGKNITVGLNENATEAIKKAHKGFGLKAEDGQNVTHQLGEAIEVVGGNSNLNTTVADGKVKINLNNTLDLTNAGSVKLGDTTLNSTGLTINNGPSITKDGVNAGTKQITNVAAGVNGTDAVNLDQLKENITNSISTEKVVKKAGDDNIATVTTQSGKEAGEKGETYEVSVSKNAVKDASREAVKVTGSDAITVTPKEDSTNHTTTYEVAYNGIKAAEVTNITYKANGANGQSVSLKDGLNFVNGTYTTASVGANGEVKYDVNVGSITNNADGKTGIPGVNGKDGLATVKTVVDAINNSGWLANATSSAGGSVDGTSTATTVKPGSVVNFDAGKNLTVKQTLDGNNHTYTYSLDKDIEVEAVVVTGKDGKDGTIGLNGKDGTNGKNGTSRVDIKVEKGVDGVDGKNGADGISRIVYEDGKGNHTVATLEDGLKFKGDDGKEIAKKLNETLNITGGANKDNLTDNNIGVNNNNGKLEVKLSKTLNLTDSGSVTIGNSTLNNGGLTIANGPSVTKDGINAGSKPITNVANGTNGTDAVNLSQLNASTAASKTEVKAGNNVNVTSETGAEGQTVYTVNANTSTVSNGSGKIKVTPTDKGNNVTDYAVDLSDEAKEQLAKEESVNATGSNVIVTENGTNDTGGKNYSVSLNNTLDLTTAGSVTLGDTVLNSTGLTINNGPSMTTGGINAGNKKITNVSEGTLSADSKDAVNGSQLYATNQNVTNISNEVAKGWNLTTAQSGTGKVSGNTTEKVAMGETVTIEAGDNINITQSGKKVTIATSNNITVGAAGKDGVDGTIGVNGKDGSAVVINGKDGTIGFNGKDGASANFTVANGTGTLDTDDKGGKGIERLVYNTTNTDGSTTTREIATKDDGLKFKGDNGKEIAKKLGETLNIIGGVSEEAKLTDNNIGVINKDGNLTVKLAKDLNLTENGSVAIGNVTLNKDGFNAGNTTITNVTSNLDPVANNITSNPDSTGNKYVNVTNNAATVGDVLNAGWNLQNNGQAVDFVTHGNTVNFKNGQGVKVGTTYNNTTGTTDITFNTTNSYVDDNGNATAEPTNKVKFIGGNESAPVAITNVDSGVLPNNATVPAGQTFNDVLNNLSGDALNNVVNAGDLKNATKDITNSTLNAVGFVLTSKAVADTNGQSSVKDGLSEADKRLTNNETFTLDAGNNVRIKQIENGYEVSTAENVTFTNITVGKDGKDGVDGTIGVNGKNGASVVINGKDGSIGLTGSKGANGKDGASANLTVVNGTGTLDETDKGKEGITRLVYNTTNTDGSTTTREIATKDDGLKFKGDNGDEIAKKLGETLNITGGADKDKLTNDNIGVNNNNGTLEVKLSKDLNLTENGSVTIGNVTINKDGFNAGNTTITNVKGNLDNVTNDTKSNPDTAGNKYQNITNNAATVGDVLNAGWNLQNNGRAVDFVTHGNTVNFNNGTGVSVNAVYDNATGTTNITFNTTNSYVDNNGALTNVPSNTVKFIGGNASAPVLITNVDSGVLPNGTLISGNDTFNDVLNNITGDALKNAVNVGDLKNATKDITNTTLSAVGFALKSAKVAGSNGVVETSDDLSDEGKRLTNNETFNLNAGNNIVIKQINNGYEIATSNNITVGKDGKDGVDGKIGVNGKDGSSVVINGKDGSIGLTGSRGSNGKDGASVNITVANGTGTLDTDDKGGKGIERLVYNTTNADGSITIREIATKDDGLKFKGDNGEEIAKKLGETLNITGGVTDTTKLTNDNIGITNENGNLSVKLSKDLNLTKDGSITVGNTTLNDKGLTIVGGPSVTIDGINAGDKKITNVANGTNATDAVNLSQLNASMAAAKTEVTAGKNVNVTSSTGANNQTIYTVNAEKSVVKGSDSVKVTQRRDEANFTTTYDIDLSDEMKKQIAKEESVSAGDTNVKVVANGTNASGGKNFEVSLNKDLNLTKEGSITLGDTTLKDGNLAMGNTTVNNNGMTIKDGPSITNGGIDGGNKKITNVSNGTLSADSKDAVNGSQLYTEIKNSGFNLATNGTDTATDKRINNNDTFTLNQGNNIVVKQIDNGYEISTGNNLVIGEKGEPGQNGQPGKDGVDGSIGVNGKDGSSVVINGKDGSIGLTGPKGADGKNGASANISVKDGSKGLDGNDGKNGESKTRIVYEKPDGKTEEVATLNDGLEFTGDSGAVSKQKLNSRVNVVGGQTDESKLSAQPNIGVVSDGKGTLSVRLAKDVNLGKDGSLTTGDTTINNGGLSIKDGPSITNNGVDAGNKVISNVANGVKGTDAVNVNQLNQIRGDIYNVNNRVDKLDKRVRGIGANAAAAASLPQVMSAGKSMVAASAGGYSGASAVAVGYSRASDNGKVILRLTGTANSAGHYSGGVGVGYQW